MATLTAKYTPDQLMALPDEKNYELVDGELVENLPMGVKACDVQTEVAYLLRKYCRETRAGIALVEVPYTCYPDDPNKLRRPDVSFIRRGRLPDGELPEGCATLAPDLAVEVVSPKDLHYEVERKAREYLAAGVRRVWVINPDLRTVRIYRPDHPLVELDEDKTLADEEVLPGFQVPVRALFQQPEPKATS